MKKKLILTLSLTFVIALVVFMTSNTSKSEGQFKYVGVQSCAGTCHKSESQGNQLGVWQNTKHSKAFKDLETPEADKIAKDKGLTVPAREAPECIKCHVLGKEIPLPECESTFDMTDGVQCESCHGPGSEYKKLSIMKDKQKAMENGLVIHTDLNSFCTNCHNQESPTFKEFDAASMWDKIKHPRP